MTMSFVRPLPLKSVTPPPFVFVRTENAHEFWRYLWPFQSVRHFMVTVAEGVVWAIGVILVAPESVELGARIAIAGGLFLAVIRMNACDELPGKITIAATRGPARELIPTLEKIFSEKGYTADPSPPKGDCIHFRPISGAGESWLYSSEQDIELCIVFENIIEVRGSKTTLNFMEMDLRWKLEE